jgi:4'-phosphopantetheinyl transferase
VRNHPPAPKAPSLGTLPRRTQRTRRFNPGDFSSCPPRPPWWDCVTTMSGSSARAACPWPPASSAARFGEPEIHLWCATLGDFYSELPRFRATLSLDERVRAGGFHSSDDRDAFVLSRGILRQLLALYLGRDASTIDFTYGRFGKPEVTGVPDHCPLYFNASRSGALVIYAVTSACPVGVDVERLRPVLELEYIASRFFTRFEADMLLTVPPDRQMERFFACWTCKEAFVKATGDGIGRGLRSVQVDPRVDACPGIGVEADLPDSWHFQLLRPATGYIAALAHRADGARLRRLRVSTKLLNRR